jgi:hypothetical protein
MNGLRRTFLALYSLLLIAAAAGVAVLAWNEDEKLDLNVSDLNISAAITSTDSLQWALTALMVAIGLLGLMTFLLAVAKSAQTGSTLRMRQADGGTVEVSNEAIETLLRDELEQLPEVRRVAPKVRLAGGAVETSLDAWIEPSASIAHATTVLGQGVAGVLRDQVGVTNVRRPAIRIHYDEVAARPVPGRTKPQAPAPAPIDFDSPRTQPATTMQPVTAAGPEPGPDEDRPANE